MSSFSSTPIPISISAQPSPIFPSGSPPQDWNSRSLGSSPNDHQTTLYKTELCRSFTETGYCRYGLRCQFAHGEPELRPVARHPKYKTAICKTFHTIGTCPYGTRCRFIHTLDQSTPENTPVSSSPSKKVTSKPKKNKRNSEGTTSPPSPSLGIRSPFSQSAPTLPTAPKPLPNGFIDPNGQSISHQFVSSNNLHHSQLPQLEKINHLPHSPHGNSLISYSSHVNQIPQSHSSPISHDYPIKLPTKPVAKVRSNGYSERLDWSEEENSFGSLTSLKPVLLSIGGVGLGGVVSMASAAAVTPPSHSLPPSSHSLPPSSHSLPPPSHSLPPPSHSLPSPSHPLPVPSPSPSPSPSHSLPSQLQPQSQPYPQPPPLPPSDFFVTGDQGEIEDEESDELLNESIVQIEASLNSVEIDEPLTEETPVVEKNPSPDEDENNQDESFRKRLSVFAELCSENE